MIEKMKSILSNMSYDDKMECLAKWSLIGLRDKDFEELLLYIDRHTTG